MIQVLYLQNSERNRDVITTMGNAYKTITLSNFMIMSFSNLLPIQMLKFFKKITFNCMYVRVAYFLKLYF